MTLLRLHPNLVRDRGEARTYLASHQGMAFFAASGPAGQVCGRCQYWLGKPDSKAAICVKYKTLMSGREGPKVPADADACKYFEEMKEDKG